MKFRALLVNYCAETTTFIEQNKETKPSLFLLQAGSYVKAELSTKQSGSSSQKMIEKDAVVELHSNASNQCTGDDNSSDTYNCDVLSIEKNRYNDTAIARVHDTIHLPNSEQLLSSLFAITQSLKNPSKKAFPLSRSYNDATNRLAEKSDNDIFLSEKTQVAPFQNCVCVTASPYRFKYKTSKNNDIAEKHTDDRIVTLYSQTLQRLSPIDNFTRPVIEFIMALNKDNQFRSYVLSFFNDLTYTYSWHNTRLAHSDYVANSPVMKKQHLQVSFADSEENYCNSEKHVLDDLHFISECHNTINATLNLPSPNKNLGFKKDISGDVDDEGKVNPTPRNDRKEIKTKAKHREKRRRSKHGSDNIQGLSPKSPRKHGAAELTLNDNINYQKSLPANIESKLKMNKKRKMVDVDDELDKARNTMKRKAIKSRNVFAITNVPRSVVGIPTNDMLLWKSGNKHRRNNQLPLFSLRTLQTSISKGEVAGESNHHRQIDYPLALPERSSNHHTSINLKDNVMFLPLGIKGTDNTNGNNHLTNPNEVSNINSLSKQPFDIFTMDESSSKLCWKPDRHMYESMTHAKHHQPVIAEKFKFHQQATGENSIQQMKLPPKGNLSSGDQIITQDRKIEGCDSPRVNVLCSETFLDSWGDVVATIASGSWKNCSTCENPQKNYNSIHNISKPGHIVFFDSPLLNGSGVDIEASHKYCFLLVTAMQLESTEKAKEIVLKVAELAAVGRYSTFYVFFCLDSEISPTITKNLVKVQFAAANSTAHILCKTTTSSNLPASLANTILSIPTAPTSEGNLEICKQRLVLDRLYFLILLLPVVSAGGAIRCLTLAKSLLPEDSPYFEILMKNQRLRQQIIVILLSRETTDALNPAAVVQLSHVLGLSQCKLAHHN
jgi:hypothetical protein